MHLKKISINFSFLLLSQALNFLAPLIIVPLLIKRVGIENTGVVLLLQTVATFLNVCTEYGFNITAIEKVFLFKNDSRKLSSLFTTVICTKLIIFLGTIPFFVLFTMSNKILVHNTLAAYLSLAIVLGQLLVPNWFFQALEKNHFSAVINAISKFLFIFLVVFFVNEGKHFYLTNFFFGVSNLFSAGCSMIILKRRFDIAFSLKVSRKEIVEQLKNGFVYFLSTASFSVINVIYYILIGTILPVKSIGYFSILERIITIIRSVLVIFFQATYPRLYEISTNNSLNIKSFFRKIFFPFFIIFFLGLAIVFVNKRIILFYFFKQDVSFLSTDMNLFLIVPIIVILNIPFCQNLLILRKSKLYALSFIFGAISALVFGYCLTLFYGLTGSILSIVVTELVMFFCFFYFSEFLSNRSILIRNINNIKN